MVFAFYAFQALYFAGVVVKRQVNALYIREIGRNIVVGYWYLASLHIFWMDKLNIINHV